MMEHEFRKCKTIVELVDRIIENSGKRVAICGWALKGSGGDCRVIEQQAKDLFDNGYDVTIFVLEADISLPQGVKIEVIGLPKNSYLSRIYRLIFPLIIYKMFKYAKKLEEFDLIICHRYPLVYLCYFAKKLYGIKYIYWFHHYPDPSHFPSLMHKLWIKLIGWLEAKSCPVKKADIICSVSEFSRRQLKEVGNIDSIVIPNKVRKLKKGVYSIELRHKYGIKENEYVMLFVGRIVPYKNIHSLIRVYKLVKNSIPNLKLVIVGNPSTKDYFEKLKEIADDGVIFTGYIPDEDLYGLYSISDVYVTCSLLEGFDLPLKEAELFGLPAVAFDIPAHREVAGPNTILVKKDNIEQFAKAVLKILQQKKLSKTQKGCVN